MTGQDSRCGPPSGTVPVVVPGDVVLARRAGLVVWAGAVTVFPGGFAVTLLTLFDTRHSGPPPSYWALDVAERGRMTWLEIGYPDGRRRAADMNANTPGHQPSGPHLRMLGGSGSYSRWWVSPLPPPGPVELAVHLSGEATPAAWAAWTGPPWSARQAARRLSGQNSRGNSLHPDVVGVTPFLSAGRRTGPPG